MIVYIPAYAAPWKGAQPSAEDFLVDDYILSISVLAMMSSQILSLSHLAISCAATPSLPGEGPGERCKKIMARPKGTGSASHTRILTEGGLPPEAVTSFPYRGTDGAARTMGACSGIVESRQRSTIGQGLVRVDVSFSSFLCAREKDKNGKQGRSPAKSYPLPPSPAPEPEEPSGMRLVSKVSSKRTSLTSVLAMTNFCVILPCLFTV